MLHSNSSVLLLLLLLQLSLTWRPSTGAALPARALGAEQCQRCSLLFRSLLDDVTELLKHKDVVCFGIKSVTPVVANVSDTVLACAPSQTQNSGCMMRRDSPFSQTECLANIKKDLDHYAATFESYLNTQLRNRTQEVPLLSPTLEQIKSLRKNCFPIPTEVPDSSKEEAASKWGGNNYENRKEMCKIIDGFYSRTITINRAMGYIASGEHRE
ncbi:interleukin-12 subunit alpha [Nelusetta ayraudi]|uniref:interleukin-12 subunit alpha n=1 Tax=Nelusetta ayraudi TaxID=303726 RepID=UPI003F7249F6